MSELPTPARHSALSNEGLRKIVHMSFGFFAFSLAWLSTLEAAAMAVAAIVFNRFVLPRFGGKRIARSDLGWDSGIVIYPVAVLLLILIFHQRPALAAIVWCILAFGDGIATLVGRNLPFGPLPWNRTKSVAGSLSFIAVAAPIAWFAGTLIENEALFPGPPLIVIVLVATLAGAIAESLPLGVDDNLVVPLFAGLAAGLVATLTSVPQPVLSTTAIVWLVVNVLLGVAAYAARSVNLSGMAGGIVLGAVLVVFAGWELYATLIAFFVIGSVSTRLGFEKKAGAGLAQESGGRRGFSHAFSNVGVAAVLAVLIASSFLSRELLWLAAIASLATASADTTASEIGQLVGRRTFLPLSFRPVPAGTEGAISLEGTVAGAMAAAIVTAVGVGLGMQYLHHALWKIGLIIAGSAVVGSWFESIVGNWNRTRSIGITNGALNFMNTMVGATLAYWFGRIAL